MFFFGGGAEGVKGFGILEVRREEKVGGVVMGVKVGSETGIKVRSEVGVKVES
jgi:hypothetical protein